MTYVLNVSEHVLKRISFFSGVWEKYPTFSVSFSYYLYILFCNVEFVPEVFPHFKYYVVYPVLVYETHPKAFPHLLFTLCISCFCMRNLFQRFFVPFSYNWHILFLFVELVTKVCTHFSVTLLLRGTRTQSFPSSISTNMIFPWYFTISVAVS
jgi:hypothetical protein